MFLFKPKFKFVVHLKSPFSTISEFIFNSIPLFSTSPKLSVSGEEWDKAIKPEVAKQYFDIPNSHLYFKFVVQDEQDLAEVDKAREEYTKAGVDADIYLMAVGATQEGQAKTAKQVAEVAMKNGYKYSPRLHVDLFGNKWGT